jgi:hypothetical protein
MIPYLGDNVNKTYSKKILHCFRYDSETSGDAVFRIVGLTESTIYLLNYINIHSAKIHVYNWLTSLENIESLENIPMNSIVPLVLPSSCFVMTIGAVDRKRRPYEQVIRIKVKNYPENPSPNTNV